MTEDQADDWYSEHGRKTVQEVWLEEQEKLRTGEAWGRKREDDDGRAS